METNFAFPGSVVHSLGDHIPAANLMVAVDQFEVVHNAPTFETISTIWVLPTTRI